MAIFDEADPEYLARVAAGDFEGAQARYRELVRGGTTPGTGLPYPNPTDPVAEGAAAIRALAEAVETHPQVRAWDVKRDGVPSGKTLYEIVPDVERIAERTPSYPNIIYSSADGHSYTLADKGWYNIFIRIYIDWQYAGAGGRIQVNADTKTDLPFAIAYFSATDGQVISLSLNGFYSNGTRKIWIQGYHNTVQSNFKGLVSFTKIRKAV